jgi:hypothetical protein
MRIHYCSHYERPIRRTQNFYRLPKIARKSPGLVAFFFVLPMDAEETRKAGSSLDASDFSRQIF